MEKALAKAIVDLVDPYITCDGEWDTKERAIADIAALLATVQSEREKEAIEVLREYEQGHAQRTNNRSGGRSDYCPCRTCRKARPMFILATPPGA